MLTTEQQTQKESALLSVLLTVSSVFATWIVAHLSSQKAEEKRIHDIKEDYQNNLRTYALKAAEKVANLSNELARLSVYLQEAQDKGAIDNSSVEARLLNERLLASIHLVDTLKSVNDTSLSDWQGVIGEELEQFREEKEEREQDVQEIADMLENIYDWQHTSLSRPSLVANEDLAKEIGRISKVLRNYITHSHSYPYVWGRSRYVEAECPSCQTTIKLRTNKKGALRYRGVICPACRSKLIAEPDSIGHPRLVVRRPIEEKIACADCGADLLIKLDNIQGASVNIVCGACSKQLRASRTKKGITVSSTGEQKGVIFVDQELLNKLSLDEDVVEKVRARLPPQPWPTGIHRTIATDLRISNSKVSSAIQYLISVGRFRPQKNGIVLNEDEGENT